MIVNAWWFLPSIIAYILFYALFLLDNKYQYPHWVVRKLIHSIGMILIGLFIIMIPSLIDVFIALTLFLILLAVFALIPPNLTQYLFLKSKRKDEKLTETIINVAITSISLILLYLVFRKELIYFLAGMYVLAIGDTFGEFFGRKFGKHKYVSILAKVLNINRMKSFEGSIAVFIGSLLGLILAIIVYDWKILIYGSEGLILIGLFIIIALCASLLESISISLIDNVLLPWGIALITHYFFGVYNIVV